MKKNLNKRISGKIELLAPAGSIDAGYAALHYGADAIYLGLENFSARSSAVNLSINELADITGYAHSLPRRRKIYAALNTLVLQNELGELIDLLALIAAIGVDAVIVQDFGVMNILRGYFPQLKIHASTQMTIHNLQGVEAAGKMGVKRVTLSRELTLNEIAGIAAKSGVETEVFIHGALCYSYSGLCLFSSHLHGRSGNRGKCAYPCREWFVPELSIDHRERSEKKGGFIFSMKDLALPEYVSELRRAGVKALKIEGRMKSPLYVAAVVNYYRRLIDGNLSPEKARDLVSDVQTIFSRPLTDLYIGTRCNRKVTDIATMGHRGSPAGKVAEIAKNSGGHCLRFQASLPLELHDGLQIDIAGMPRPFGFAVKNINILGDGRSPGQKRVFTAPAGARVEIQLPRGHPAIPVGAMIYSSSSQKVKQRYDFLSPKPGLFRLRQAADFEVRVENNGVDVTASANVFPGIKGKPVRVSAHKHFEGIFQPADNVSHVSGAVAGAFAKLGNTGLKPGRLVVENPRNLFIPLSRLNAIRRDISGELERQIVGLPRRCAADIKIALSAILPGNIDVQPACPVGKDKRDNFNWSIKTDQPHLLFAFGPDDWRGINEVIIECTPGTIPVLYDQLERLAGQALKPRLRLALPVIIRQWEMELFAKTVPEFIKKGWHKWQISNLGVWSLLKNLCKRGVPLDISADWPLYTMNRAAVLELINIGVKKFTLSPEDGLENMRELLTEFSESASVIVYQDTPLMVSETCVFAGEKCSGKKNCRFREMIFDSSHGKKIRVVNHNCRIIVVKGRPFCLVDHLRELAEAGAANLRADFINREYSEQELLDTWRKLRVGDKNLAKHIGNFHRGLG